MKKYIIPILVLLWLTLTFYLISNYNFPIMTLPAQLFINNQQYKVKRVVDGDTIELENGQKVRYIGINTPETVDPRRPVQCFGIESSLANKKLVEGKAVTLEKDVSETDKYGRLLRYVYLGNVFVNEYLVRNGFAQVSSYPPDVKYQNIFLKAQQEARRIRLGLWNKCQK